MAKFNAGTAVEALEYDFTDFGGGSGTIPEPSSDQLDDFMDGVVATMEQYKDLAKVNLQTTNEQDVAALLEKFGDIKSKDMLDSLADLIGAFCSESPSADEIKRLPFRIQQAFLGWLMGEFRPEGAAPTSKQ